MKHKIKGYLNFNEETQCFVFKGEELQITFPSDSFSSISKEGDANDKILEEWLSMIKPDSPTQD